LPVYQRWSNERGGIMSKKIALIGVLGAMASLVLPAVPASAGGGGACNYGSATSSHTTTIVLSKACFTPTLARVPVGSQVRWVNKDPLIHTVTAAHNAWGSTKDLQTDDFITMTFSRPGVYPYYCLYHTGMAGAVLVGDANGVGAASERSSVTPVDETLAKTSPVKVGSTTPDRASRPVIAIALSLAVGGVGFGIGRRVRKTSP
jgi:plastocyanin